MVEMKLSFTTNGCPDWDIDTIITRAKEYGYDAVDIRGLKGDLNTPQIPEFSTQARETAEKFRDADLPVPCFSTSIFLFTPLRSPRKPLKASLEEVKRYAELCQVFDSEYLRVFGGRIENLKRSDAVTEAASILDRMGDMASEYGVKVLFETHDDWSSSVNVKSLMEELSSKHVSVLWDVLHTVLEGGEDPDETWQNVGKWVRHTHLKDAIRVNDRIQICLVGEGSLPLRQFVDVLRKDGYDGYYSLEWVKNWNPEIEEPEVAFPHFVKYMRSLFSGS